MKAWQLRNDVVEFEGLRLRLHRIGRSHWQAGSVMRSWGAVALHREGDALHAPCAADEALWLGAWLDDEDATATVLLADRALGLAASIALPGAFQIATLASPHGKRHPIEQSDAGLSMTLGYGPALADIALLLHTPVDWAALSKRPVPDAVNGPPPPPPRLG